MPEWAVVAVLFFISVCLFSVVVVNRFCLSFLDHTVAVLDRKLLNRTDRELALNVVLLVEVVNKTGDAILRNLDISDRVRVLYGTVLERRRVIIFFTFIRSVSFCRVIIINRFRSYGCASCTCRCAISTVFANIGCVFSHTNMR